MQVGIPDASETSKPSSIAFACSIPHPRTGEARLDTRTSEAMYRFDQRTEESKGDSVEHKSKSILHSNECMRQNQVSGPWKQGIDLIRAQNRSVIESSTKSEQNIVCFDSIFTSRSKKEYFAFCFSSTVDFSESSLLSF